MYIEYLLGIHRHVGCCLSVQVLDARVAGHQEVVGGPEDKGEGDGEEEVRGTVCEASCRSGAIQKKRHEKHAGGGEVQGIRGDQS